MTERELSKQILPENIREFREKMASITLKPFPRDYRREATEYFLGLGFPLRRLHSSEVDLREVQTGDSITCADYRHDDTHDPGPAYFGGAHGLLTLIDPILPLEVRYAVLNEMLKMHGLKPGDHGLGIHYPVPDCAFIKAALAQKIPGLEELSHEHIITARQEHGFGHRILRRHTVHPDTVVYNFLENQKVVPHGQYYVVEAGVFNPLAQNLGKDLEDILRLSVHVMGLVHADKVLIV